LNISGRPLAFIPGTKTIQIRTKDHLNFSDEELLICTYRLPGFSLATKRWEYFNVTGIKDVSFSVTAFDGLVIPRDKKDLISSLIKVPGNETMPFDDLIEGKGKGLIFLLHGPPGVGKTLLQVSLMLETEET